MAKSIFKFILFSNLFIAVCAAAASWQTYIMCNIQVNVKYVVFVFLSTLVFYNAQRLFLLKNYKRENASFRHLWILENKKLLLILSITAFVVALPLLIFWKLKLILLFSVFSIIASFYFLPQLNLRSVVLLKATYISLLWVFSTFFFPLLLHHQDNENMLYSLKSGYVLLMSIERFLFILPLCMVFNIRDLEIDRINGVKTIPMMYGLGVTKAIVVIMLLIFSVLVIYRSYYFGFSAKYGELMQSHVPALIASALVTVFILLAVRKDRGEYYYLLGVDGMILLQCLLLLFVKNN